METGSHELVVEDYSIRCKGIGVNKPIESEQFVVGGHRWAIRFYPDGRVVDAYNTGYASLFISLKSENTKPVHFLCELYVLDQSGEGIHHGISAFEGEKPYKEVKSITRGVMVGNYYFIKRASLEYSSSVYLKDDCLRIRATIGVLACHSQNPSLLTIGEDFDKLLESKQSADLFFKVADQSFCSHKLILAAGCPALLSRLSDGGQPLQDSIVIPDMEPEIFKALLRFIYTGLLQQEKEETDNVPGHSILESFLAKMLAAAYQFKLKKLQEICESRLLGKVSGESVGYLLHLADAFDAAKLKSSCLKFAAENKAAFMESDGCEYLKETCPLLFLELAGGEDNSSTSRKWVRNLCNKVLSTFKESLAGTDWRWGATYTRQKIKEV